MTLPYDPHPEWAREDELIKKLTAQAAEWEAASERLAVDEPCDMGTVEDDTMSAIYGECAGVLRRLISEAGPGPNVRT